MSPFAISSFFILYEAIYISCGSPIKFLGIIASFGSKYRAKQLGSFIILWISSYYPKNITNYLAN